MGIRAGLKILQVKINVSHKYIMGIKSGFWKGWSSDCGIGCRGLLRFGGQVRLGCIEGVVRGGLILICHGRSHVQNCSPLAVD